ncbi:MAG: helix-turn-helix domain containing protein [Devosia sp.]|nr:helix-turn-helix domain containing protein [Devosia sp.]
MHTDLDGNAPVAEAADSGPGRPRAAARILKSARELFYHQGIRAVGVDEIVANAGVTKPSLYRSYASKDELAASYLRLYEDEFWERFEASVARHPGDPRAQLMDYLEGLAARVALPEYRGCGLSNATVEYPQPDHPARLVAEQHKAKLRARLTEMAGQMGARDSALLGDSLFLLLEGTLVASQIFHHRADGPAGAVARAADLLIGAALAR